MFGRICHWTGFMILILIFIPVLIGLVLLEFLNTISGGCDRKKVCRYYREDSDVCNVDGPMNPIDGTVYCGKYDEKPRE